MKLKLNYNKGFRFCDEKIETDGRVGGLINKHTHTQKGPWLAEEGLEKRGRRGKGLRSTYPNERRGVSCLQWWWPPARPTLHSPFALLAHTLARARPHSLFSSFSANGIKCTDSLPRTQHSRSNAFQHFHKKLPRGEHAVWQGERDSHVFHLLLRVHVTTR